MIELELVIDGKKKKFERPEMMIKDNIIAVKHQIKENQFWVSDVAESDKYDEVSMSLLNTVAELFEFKFTPEILLKQPVKTIKEINKIYNKALGGEEEVKDEDKKEKK